MASQSTRRSAANPYVTGGPSRYLQTKGGTSSIPSTGIRTGGTISVGGAPSAKGGAPSAKVPTGGEPGEPTNLPEAYNPIIDAETENAPIDPNRQETIANQARVPRFSIGNPRVGNIDLGSLLSAKSSEGFDPNAPIGGANVPFQETKGVGGFFRRMFGDTANEQNVAAQQVQGAEWKRDAALDKQRQAKREDLAEEIRLREEGPAARFAATEKRLADKEIQDEIERNNAIDLGLVQAGNEAVLKDVDMVLREKADAAKQALEERRVALAEDAYKSPSYQAVNDPKGNVLFYNPKTGRPTGTFRQPNFGMVTDPNDPTKQILGTTAGGYEGIGPSGSANEPQVTGFGDSYVNGLDASGNKFGKLPPPPKPAPAPASAMTPPRSADTSPMAEASLLGRFKQAMPSLNLERSPGPGVQSPYLSEGEMGQRVMEQIAYPLRAAVADEAKGEFQNPQAAFSVLSRPPMFRLKRPDSMEMQQSRKAADILRQMYAE